jgi:predicted enzyme related to lactoylglutathione lyase
MSNFNSKNNRAVWFDIPVNDLDGAQEFYAAVLGIGVHKEAFGDFNICVLDHQDGNGGCLVPAHPGEITATGGLLLYLIVDGRIKDAVAQVQKLGGRVTEPIHSIGLHGFRAVVLDSEGNRVALHSNSDV